MLRSVKRYIKYGRDLLYDRSIREKILGIAEPIVEAFIVEPTPEAAVIAEVEADLNSGGNLLAIGNI